MLKSLGNLKDSAALVYHFLRDVLPLVNREVDFWQDFVTENMTGELRKQALASIRTKRFHCQGGSFYSLYPGVETAQFIPFVVALQTISDYLDNLCDRASVTSEAAFCTLHCAMTDALDPDAAHKAYYRDYPFQDDGGYLDRLVDTCQTSLRNLPSYRAIRDDLLKLASLYSALQTYKHIALDQRESAMRRWLAEVNTSQELTDWEFAAATGSTLGMFMLVALAHRPRLGKADGKGIRNAYFPWICGLHILLDYFVDQAEDRQNGDLNFVFYYADDRETERRLTLFYRNAQTSAARTPHSYFAQTIVRGLTALYLSDPKVTAAASEARIGKKILSAAGLRTRLLYRLCLQLRRKNIL